MPTNVLLAQEYSRDIDPTDWWLSEKLNGIRAVWDGKYLRSRNGIAFSAPNWFLTNFPPSIKLDGELWIGRGKYLQETNSIVSSTQDKGWNRIKYMVFDIPDITGGGFEVRQQLLSRVVSELNKTNQLVEMVPQTKCLDRTFFNQVFDLVVNAGGEGLMLRKPGSRYETKRSSSLLKYKKFHDAEAIIIGYQEGEGKNTGKMGALLCETIPSSGLEAAKPGVKFKVGTGFSDYERENPPAVGLIITYQFQELTNSGTPRHPSYIGIRKDVLKEIKR